MSRPMALPVWPDAAGGEQHVGPAAGAEVEDRLALVQVGDRGRDAAAQRRLDGAVGYAVGLGGVVEGAAEDLVAGSSEVATSLVQQPAGSTGRRARAAAA